VKALLPHIRWSAGPAGRLVPADYAAVMSSLTFLLRPGRVQRLLKVAEEQGVLVPEDLA
jgi:hypothetical protein